MSGMTTIFRLSNKNHEPCKPATNLDKYGLVTLLTVFLASPAPAAAQDTRSAIAQVSDTALRATLNRIRNACSQEHWAAFYLTMPGLFRLSAIKPSDADDGQFTAKDPTGKIAYSLVMSECFAKNYEKGHMLLTANAKGVVLTISGIETIDDPVKTELFLEMLQSVLEKYQIDADITVPASSDQQAEWARMVAFYCALRKDRSDTAVALAALRVQVKKKKLNREVFFKTQRLVYALLAAQK